MCSHDDVTQKVWSGSTSLLKNLRSMDKACADFVPGEGVTLEDLITWALSSPWVPFDAVLDPFPNFPLPLPPPPPPPDQDDVMSFDGIFERRDQVRGRYLVASRDLEPGETLIEEKPFASIVNHNHTEVVCCSCKKTLFSREERIVCGDCHNATWCSPRCQSISIPLFHAYECPYLRTSEKRWLVKSRHFRLASRMIVKGWRNVVVAFKADLGIDDDKGNSSQSASEFDLVANHSCILHFFEKSAERTYPLQCALWTKTYLYFLKSAGFLERIKEQVIPFINNSVSPETMDKKLERFVASTLLQHVVRLKCNSFESFHSVVGLSIYLRIAQINHSCQPNCNNFFRGDTHVIRTWKRIKSGEEICIVYDRAVAWMPTKQRRNKHMRDNFGFDCLCRRCDVDDDDDDDDDVEGLSAAEDDVEDETRRHIQASVKRCLSLFKSERFERAEASIYEASAAARTAGLLTSEAELFEILNEVQSRFDLEKICVD